MSLFLSRETQVQSTGLGQREKLGHALVAAVERQLELLGPHPTQLEKGSERRGEAERGLFCGVTKESSLGKRADSVSVSKSTEFQRPAAVRSWWTAK